MSAGLRIFLVSLIVAGYANLIGAWLAPPLSLDNLGPFALVWHDRSVALFLVPTIIVALALLRVKGAARNGLLVLYGVLIAQTITRIGLGSSPDYIVIRPIDTICNLPDLMMMGTVLVLALVAPFKRLRQS